MATLTVEDFGAETANSCNSFAFTDVVDHTQHDETLLPGIVDTPTAIEKLVDLLSNLPSRPPSIYVDIEGVNLSRHGTISIVQIHVLPTKQTYLVDVHTLRERAFLTATLSGYTLKSILESKAIPKAFFDIRNDSDALYTLFGVKVAGICDIQLMELATRSFSKRCLKGLAKCIETDLPMTFQEQQKWKSTKETGIKLFSPKYGGNYEVFNLRPLSEEIGEYCMQDVQLLPRLWQYYDSKITHQWMVRVENATNDRILLSQSAKFNGTGAHMALGPWG